MLRWQAGGPFIRRKKLAECGLRRNRTEGRFVDFYKAKGNDADTFSKRQHNGFKVPIENTGDKKQEVHRFKQKDMDLSIFFGGSPLQQNIVPV